MFYAYKILADTHINFTTTKNDFFFCSVSTLEKFRPCILGGNIIIYIDYAALKNLLSENKAKTLILKFMIIRLLKTQWHILFYVCR